MKQRVVSALIAIAIVFPIILIGGNLYNAGVILLGVLALIEFISAKDSVKKIPNFMKFLSIYSFVFGLLEYFNYKSEVLISVRYIVLYSIALLLGLILYKDKKKFDILDASYLLFTNLFLLIGFQVLAYLRDYNLNYLIVVLLITVSSDTFAYITGLLIGKNKLCESISPNKTVEGFIGGVLFCLIISVPLSISLINYNGNVFVFILIVLMLSIMSSLGDLAFSMIKRNFDIKDYGHIMPGHGGVLDRLDSFLFVLLSFYLILEFI